MVDPTGVLGSLASAGVNFFQGERNRQAQADANAQAAENAKNATLMQIGQDQRNFAAQQAQLDIQNRQTDLSNAFQREQFEFSKQMADRNEALAREFATHGIQWRAEDARAAGLHPLYAMGMSGVSAPALSVGSFSLGSSPSAGSGSSGGFPVHSPSPVTDSSRMGQDIGRAVEAVMSEDQRVARALNLENAALQNDYLRAQISSINARAARNPSFPVADPYGLTSGQNLALASGLQPVFKPLQVTADPNDRKFEGGSVADVGAAAGDRGNVALIPGEDVHNRIEDLELYEKQHFVRNQLAPWLSRKGFSPPKQMGPAASGKAWAVNPLTGNWIQVPQWLFDWNWWD